jgi:hypothetical protein
MEKRLKNMFLFSSLGSVLIGAGVALARNKTKVVSPAFQASRIPADCPQIMVLTEALQLVDRKGLRRGRYLLQKTAFKVWSVLDLPVTPGKDHPGGATVYYVTWSEIEEIPGQTPASETEKGRFYGTIAASVPGEATVRKNFIARGAVLQIHKCYVGGASNGVETGEIHKSDAPVLNYRLEYHSEQESKTGGEGRLA